MRWPFIKVHTPRYNGFGGKVEHGELPAQAAIRELKVRPLVDALRPSHAKKRRSAVLKLHSTTAGLFFSSAKEDQNGRFRLNSIVQTPTVGLSSSLSFLVSPSARPL